MAGDSSTTSTKTWTVVHVIYPMFPFVLEGAIRFLATAYTLSFDTFSSSTLAMSDRFTVCAPIGLW